jgi:hypothetical protein
MNTVNIKLYNILKNDIKLPDAKAQEFIQALDEVVQADIKNSSTEYRSLVKEDILKMEISLRGEIMKIDAKLDSKMGEVKNDLVKWMFAFWIGTIGIALLFYFLKK